MMENIDVVSRLKSTLLLCLKEMQDELNFLSVENEAGNVSVQINRDENQTWHVEAHGGVCLFVNQNGESIWSGDIAQYCDGKWSSENPLEATNKAIENLSQVHSQWTQKQSQLITAPTQAH